MNGVLPLLKPPGMSSSEAVQCVRRIAGVRRCGHAGTLDPEAAGVLPVMLGMSTKLSDYLMHSPKEYIAELRVGLETDTLDSEGRVTASHPGRFAADDLERILPRFTGRIEQVPPRYSAIKIAGRPLYDYARSGLDVGAPVRTVQVDAIELLSSRPDRFLLRIACRQGTYVRALLRDLAYALGTVGYTSFLLRTRAGHFGIEDTCTLDELADGDLPRLLRTPADAVRLERIDLPAHLYRILDSGAAIDMTRVPGLTVTSGREYAVWCRGFFFGIGQLADRGLKLRVRLREPGPQLQ